MVHPEDPHFEEVSVQLETIQSDVDKLIFYSVFVRLPAGVSEHQAPNIPNDALNRVDALTTIERIQRQTAELEDRLKELQENNSQFADLIEDYLNDIDEIDKAVRNIKIILQPELLHDGEGGKSEVSWLTTYKNILGTKLHREHNQLEEISDSHPENNEETLDLLKKLDRLIATAGMLQDCARYLQWFTNRVVETNESLPEYQKDFTVGLVAGWINAEGSKVKEHEQNCFNVKMELEKTVSS